MYTEIINPLTNRKVNIGSKLGIKILKNYINYVKYGGTIMWHLTKFSSGANKKGSVPDKYDEAEANAINKLEVKLTASELDVGRINMEDWWRGSNTSNTKRGKSFKIVNEENKLWNLCQTVEIDKLKSSIKYLTEAVRLRTEHDNEQQNKKDLTKEERRVDPHSIYTKVLAAALKLMEEIYEKRHTTHPILERPDTTSPDLFPSLSEVKKQKKTKSSEEKRYDADDGPFTKAEFIKFYGSKEDANQAWNDGEIYKP
jgi:hypothetical protein